MHGSKSLLAHAGAFRGYTSVIMVPAHASYDAKVEVVSDRRACQDQCTNNSMCLTLRCFQHPVKLVCNEYGESVQDALQYGLEMTCAIAMDSLA